MKKTGWALAAVFGGLAWIMLSESLLRPKQELLYKLSPVFVLCSKGAPERCTARYRLVLGNSGAETIPAARVHWPEQFADWRFDWKASDLVGSARPRSDPRVRQSGDAGQEIFDLAPNTLLEVNASCDGCSRTQLAALRDASVRIEAPGRVLETEPRLTTFGRLVLNAARLASYLF